MLVNHTVVRVHVDGTDGRTDGDRFGDREYADLSFGLSLYKEGYTCIYLFVKTSKE